MSFKQYMVLFFMLIGYLLLGATMFYYVEHPLEEERRALAKAKALEIRELLHQHFAKGLPQAHLELVTHLSDYCDKPFYTPLIDVDNDTDNTTTTTTTTSTPEEPYKEKPFLWTFYNSVLFVLYTLSTIGYGSPVAPTSRQGRILDVIYGLIGIPLMGIVVAQMADYWGSLTMRVHYRYKSHEYQTRLSLFADILKYLLLGMIMFVFFPAAIFVYFEEDWTFDTGVYYAFITLTTIGYGDLVAGQNGTDTLVYDVYKIMVLVWIMFGLGYMVMIVSYITRAMRSKKVRKIEHKLAHTINQTQTKIWNEFSQDVMYLRRMLNEMHLLSIQPVYVQKNTEKDKEGVRRVKSCPNLTEWPILRKRENSEPSEEDEEETAANFRRIAMRRRKGNAENLIKPRVKKTVSEEDLSRIDRIATFGEDSGPMEPKRLLAKVVDALGTSIGSKFSLDDYEDALSRKTSTRLNGIHGFSDEEILASERLMSRWSLGGHNLTISEHSTPSKRNSLLSNEESRTWSGVNAVDIQRFNKMRANGELQKSNLAFDTRSLSFSPRSSVGETGLKPLPSRMHRMSMAVTNLFSQNTKSKAQDEKDLQDSKTNISNISGIVPSLQNKRKSLPHEDQAQSKWEQVNYLSHTSGRRGSVFAALANEIRPKSSSGVNIPISPVLEQTSVADFLRLLTSLQAKLDPTLSLPPGTQESQNQLTNRRKSAVRESVVNSLAMLFSPPTGAQPTSETANEQQQPSTVLPNTPQIHRKVLALKGLNVLEGIGKTGRRFSLIPPMDVDHPSGQINYRDILKLKKRHSSQNMLQQSDGSTVNIPDILARPRSQRTSLSGSARYINSKLQNSPSSQKTVPPSLTALQGFRDFSVRPVSIPDIPPQLDPKPNPPETTQVSPTITVENCDSKPSTLDVEDDYGLNGIVVVRL